MYGFFLFLPMDENNSDVLRKFRLRNVLWPVLIGLIVTLGLFLYKELFSGEESVLKALESISWTYWSLMYIGIGFLMMVLRDLGYVWRMRILTDGKLSWRQCLEVTLLWEFASALSPSVVGGSAVAIFMLMREKISAGRSTAIVFVTVFLDELFYVLMLPVVLLIVGNQAMFYPVTDMDTGDEVASLFGQGLMVSFWIAYGVIVAYTLFLAFAIFFRPYASHMLIKRLFFARFLKRWQRRGIKMANELLISAEEFKSKPLSYWFQAFLATLISWMARYLVLNAVLAAFAVTALGFYGHTVAFARQAIMFVMMIISPTPGSSGVAEFIFSQLLEDLTPAGLAIALAALWRLISYYPYLLIGPLLLPRRLRRGLKDSDEEKAARLPDAKPRS